MEKVRFRYWWYSLIIIALLLAVFKPSCAVIPQTQLDWGEHPRLLFTAAEIPELRRQAETTHHDIWQPIELFVESVDADALLSVGYSNKDYDFFREQGNQLIALAFACVIADQAGYCDLTTALLVMYAQWPQWDEANQRGLGLAHMLIGNALAYDWLYPRLNDQEHQIIRNSLAHRTNEMYEASSQADPGPWNNWWWKAYLQNHFFIANSALGIASLALVGEPIEAQAICTISARSNVNLRTDSSTNAEVGRMLYRGQTATIRQQGTEGADGFIWWYVVDDGLWVRSDVVSAPYDCEEKPLDAQAQIWLNQAISQLVIGRDVLNAISDGSWHESIPYQNYLLTLTLPFMRSLKTLCGFDLLPHDYLRQYSYWRLYNLLPDGDFILPYGDVSWSWHNGFAPQAALRFIAHEHGDGYAAWTAQQMVETIGRFSGVWHAPWYVFEFLYYDPQVNPTPPDNLQGTRVFDDLEGVIWRTDWSPYSLVFGLKTGAYGGRFAFDSFTHGMYPWTPPCQLTQCQLSIGHDHDDTNSFYIYRNGEWLVPESAGVDQNQTSFHNTLLIDDQGQYRPPYENYGQFIDDFVNTDGNLEYIASSRDFDVLSADSTRRYAQFTDLQDITRHVLFVRPNYWVMFDTITAAAAHQYTWIAHFGMLTTVEDRWIGGITGGGQMIGVGVLLPEAFEVTTGNDGEPYVHLSTTQPAPQGRFVTVLYPTDRAAWEVKPQPTLLDDTPQAVGVRIEWRAGQVDDILMAESTPQAEMAVGPYHFDGRAAVVRRGLQGELHQVFVTGGTMLSASGTVLVRQMDPNGSFEAVYDGERLMLFGGDDLSAIVVYAPDAREVLVDNVAHSFVRDGDYITLSE